MMFGSALIPEVFNGNKTVTRRPASTRYRPGNEQEIVCKGSYATLGKLVVVKVTDEELGMVDDAEAKLEGFSGHQQFVDFWIREYGSWDTSTKVKRIEFRVTEQIQKLCPTCDGVGALPMGVTV